MVTIAQTSTRTFPLPFLPLHLSSPPKDTPTHLHSGHTHAAEGHVVTTEPSKDHYLVPPHLSRVAVEGTRTGTLLGCVRRGGQEGEGEWEGVIGEGE